MSIFANKVKTEVDDTQISAGILPTSECLDEILTESARESYQIRAGMYIADIMMESAVLEGSATPEVLLEAFARDIWDKIKQMFVNLWTKIKQWFAAVKRQLALWFTSGKEFATKFEQELMDKTVTGYEYKSYSYDMKAAYDAAIDIINEAQSLVYKYSNGLDDYKNLGIYTNRQKDALDKKLKNDSLKKEYDTSKEKEKVLKKLGADSFEELQKNLIKVGRGGKDEKEELKDFAGVGKKEMINALKNKEKIIGNIRQLESDNEKHIKSIIKAIESAKSKYSGDDVAKITPYVKHSIEMLRFAIALDSNTAKGFVALVKESCNEFERILKGYLRYKPAKESFGDDEETQLGGTKSILEAAIDML